MAVFFLSSAASAPVLRPHHATPQSSLFDDFLFPRRRAATGRDHAGQGHGHQQGLRLRLLHHRRRGTLLITPSPLPTGGPLHSQLPTPATLSSPSPMPSLLSRPGRRGDGFDERRDDRRPPDPHREVVDLNKASPRKVAPPTPARAAPSGRPQLLYGSSRCPGVVSQGWGTDTAQGLVGR